MKILLVDDEKYSLEGLKRAVNEACEGAGHEITSIWYKVGQYKKILNLVTREGCDVIFLDIELPGISGVELAKKLLEINPKLNVIFVTAYSDYTVKAWDLRASGYIMKPATKERIQEELSALRYGQFSGENSYNISGRGVFIKTFGNFEIYCQGKPIAFKRRRAKEILAYLVDRQGAMVSLPEIADVVFEEPMYGRREQKNIQVYIHDLLEGLKNVNAEEVVIRQRGYIGLNMNIVDCDYFDFLNNKPEARNTYTGDYMKSYSWAEFTAGWIDKKLRD